MFDKMKQVYEMQKKAKELQRQMEAIRIEKASRDGFLKVTVNGTNKVEAISVDPSYLAPSRQRDLEKALKELVNDAFADIHQKTAAQAAELMKGIPGLNLPGF